MAAPYSSVPLPPIAPVELMLASIGIRPIITRKVEKISRADLNEMVTMPSAIVRLSRQIVQGEQFETTFGKDSYRDLLTDLARGWDYDQAQEMLEKVPTDYHVIASAVLVKASSLIAEMDKDYPTSTYVTLSGETKLAISDKKSYSFFSILECIDRPLVVFELMSTGAILQSQVNAIREVYPTMAKNIDAALLDSISRARAAKQSFQLPAKAERGIRAWFGKGPIPIKAMAKAQETAKIQAQKEAEQKEAKAKADKEEMTQVQRSELAG